MDLFCGAGGTSTGILNAARRRRQSLTLTAVNHWTTAINSHTLNHRTVRHICESVETLNPRAVVPCGRLHLLAASCECTFHSNARGGGPCNEQSRSQPWQILRWVTALRVENILMENVPEFVKWGPLLTRRLRWRGKVYKVNHPDPRQKGLFFRNFIKALEDHGYTVEWKIQNAADFGDATVRRRFILMARADRQPITWPEPSHQDAALPMVPRRQAWLTARDHVIDWSLEGRSIFGRKKPLSANTLKRIAAGLRTFGGPSAEPFLVMLRGTTDAHLNGSHQSVDEPIPAVTTTGKHHYLAQPFLIPAAHNDANGRKPRVGNLDAPLPSVLGSNAHALVEPFIIPKHSRDRARSVDKPMPAMTTRQGQALVEPMIIGQQSCAAARPVSSPIPTVAARGAIALVQPFITHSTHHGTRRGEMNLIEAIIVQTDQTGSNGHCCQTVDSPIKTVVSKQNMALVEPFVVKYYGTGIAKHLRQPLDAVTTKDRFLLVEPKTHQVLAELDIRFRMLQPHELAAAHSFPAHYRFTGTKEDQTKQIGNSVPVRLAEAHAYMLLNH